MLKAVFNVNFRKFEKLEKRIKKYVIFVTSKN